MQPQANNPNQTESSNYGKNTKPMDGYVSTTVSKLTHYLLLGLVWLLEKDQFYKLFAFYLW